MAAKLLKKYCPRQIKPKTSFVFRQIWNKISHYWMLEYNKDREISELTHL